jgi:hypothetical protein
MDGGDGYTTHLNVLKVTDLYTYKWLWKDDSILRLFFFSVVQELNSGLAKQALYHLSYFTSP